MLPFLVSGAGISESNIIGRIMMIWLRHILNAGFPPPLPPPTFWSTKSPLVHFLSQSTSSTPSTLLGTTNCLRRMYRDAQQTTANLSVVTLSLSLSTIKRQCVVYALVGTSMARWKALTRSYWKRFPCGCFVAFKFTRRHTHTPSTTPIDGHKQFSKWSLALVVHSFEQYSIDLCSMQALKQGVSLLDWEASSNRMFDP